MEAYEKPGVVDFGNGKRCNDEIVQPLQHGQLHDLRDRFYLYCPTLVVGHVFNGSQVPACEGGTGNFRRYGDIQSDVDGKLVDDSFSYCPHLSLD